MAPSPKNYEEKKILFETRSKSLKLGRWGEGWDVMNSKGIKLILKIIFLIEDLNIIQLSNSVFLIIFN